MYDFCFISAAESLFLLHACANNYYTHRFIIISLAILSSVPLLLQLLCRLLLIIVVVVNLGLNIPQSPWHFFDHCWFHWAFFHLTDSRLLESHLAHCPESDTSYVRPVPAQD